LGTSRSKVTVLTGAFALKTHTFLSTRWATNIRIEGEETSGETGRGSRVGSFKLTVGTCVSSLTDASSRREREITIASIITIRGTTTRRTVNADETAGTNTLTGSGTGTSILTGKGTERQRGGNREGEREKDEEREKEGGNDTHF
jgi:hypothetical protein